MLVECLLVSHLSGRQAHRDFSPREGLDSGRYLQVLQESEKELRERPSNAAAWAAKSQALTALLRLPEAQEAAQKAIALQPNLADALLARGMATAALAVQQRNLGSVRKASAALRDFQSAVQADPSYAEAWFSLGMAYQQLPGIFGGSTREALRCSDRLAAINPARGQLLRGMVLALDKRWAEAEPSLTSAVGRSPGDPQVVYGYLESLSLRSTRETLGRDPWKSRLAASARRLGPGVKGSGRGSAAVSDALLDADAPEEAWGVAQAALASGDAPSLSRLQLGKVSARSGLHLQEGLAALDRVLSEPLEGGTGGYATAHWRRGQILQRLGRTAEARQAARAALAIDPKHPGASRLLADLGSEK